MVEINLIKDIVFFSSTFRDFQEARQKILLGFQNLDIKVEAMEHFDASSTPIKEECLRRLEESQVYLLVVGEMYGSIDSETKLSYTELEYNRAVELKQQNKIKDIWVFKPTNKYEPLPEHIEIDDAKKYHKNIGQKFSEFYVKEVCGQITTVTDEGTKTPSISFVSFFSGLVLASELIKHHMYTFKGSPMKNKLDFLQFNLFIPTLYHIVRRPKTKQCLLECCSSDIQEIFAKKWNLSLMEKSIC